MSILILLGMVVVLYIVVRRLLKKSREPFHAYQEKQLRHSEEVLASIHEDAKTLKPEEAMRPVVAGVRELVELKRFACSLNDQGSALQVSTPTLTFEVVWILRTAHLTAATVPRQGDNLRKGHWELHILEGGETDISPLHASGKVERERFDDLLPLMARVEILMRRGIGEIV